MLSGGLSIKKIRSEVCGRHGGTAGTVTLLVALQSGSVTLSGSNRNMVQCLCEFLHVLFVSMCFP